MATWFLVLLLGFIMAVGQPTICNAGIFDDVVQTAVQSIVDKSVPSQDEASRQVSNQPKQEPARIGQLAQQSSGETEKQEVKAVAKKDPYTDEDVRAFKSTFKTNMGADELTSLFNSKLHLIAVESDDAKFSQVLFYLGSGNLSLDQRKRMIGDYVVDSGVQWGSRIMNIDKINSDTIRLGFELMDRPDPTASLRPGKREFYLRWNTRGGVLTLIQMKAYGTSDGDLQLDNDQSSGYVVEKVYMNIMQGLTQFFQVGRIE